MNIIILQKEDFINENEVILRDRRGEHIKNVHKAELGQSLRVGMLNGKVGEGIVTEIGDPKSNAKSCEKLVPNLAKVSAKEPQTLRRFKLGEFAETFARFYRRKVVDSPSEDNNYVKLQVTLDQEPPKPLEVKLILALPRPKAFRRVLQHITALGVKEIYLINTWRVEKSFWKSPYLEDEKILEDMILGLEQAKDTILPKIYKKSLFKPFVEDELPEIIKETFPIVAHPIAESECPFNLQKAVTLAIGPEGGFIDYEVKKLQEIGFTSFHLGERILRVETAIPYILGRLGTF